MAKQLSEIKHLPIILFLISFVIYSFNAWGVSIYILDEAKNATCAREMLDRRDLFVPTFNQVLRTDKPPLHYFFMMISYSIFGVNPFAARFFSAVFGALTILITFLFTKKYTNSKTALWTVLVLLASIHLSLQFHLAVPDPYLIFFFTACLFLFYDALSGNKIFSTVLMYSAMGLGTLTKGPVAVLLPGLIFLLFLIFSKQLKWKTIIKLKPLLGGCILLIIALPWYISNGINTDWEWIRGFFLKHNVNRFSGAMEGHGGSFLLTFLFVFLGLFPFALFFPQVIRTAFKNRNNRFLLFCLVAGLTIVSFFSVSQTKLPNYTVPAYPFLAVLFGYYISNVLKSFKQVQINFYVLAVIGILVPIVGFYALKFDPSLTPVKHYALIFIILPFALIFAFINRKKIQKHLLYIVASGLVTALVFFALVFPVLDKQNPVQQSLCMVENSEVVSFEKFNPSYSFYLKKEIRKIDEFELKAFFEKYPDGKIISTKKILEKVTLPENCEIIYEGKDLFELPTTVILSKKTD